jgi:hypothetical protein
MKSPPQSPSQLADALAAIFPTLPRDFASSGESVLEDAGPTDHSVMREFSHFFSKEVDQFSDRQLRRFAEFIARCVATPGPLQDAVETCFLQQALQSRSAARFQPFLAAAMKQGG